MIIDRRFDGVKFMHNLFLLSLPIFLQVTSYHQIGAIPCVLRNGARGRCTELTNCISALYQLEQSTTLEFCNYERDEVCCLDANRETYITKAEEVLPGGIDPQNSKTGKVGNNGSDRKRNNQNVREEFYNFEKNPNNLYVTKGKQSPHHAHKNFPLSSSDDNYFLPPGISKKKPWNNEKTTPDDYYYEAATPKPHRHQNHINRPYEFEEDNSPKVEYERTTKRNTENNNWFFPETDFSNNYDKTTKRNQRPHQTTTRRNQFIEETTTRRNFGNRPGGNRPDVNFQENERPNRRPLQPVNEQLGFLEPTNPSNKPPKGRRRKSEIMCAEYSKEITRNITGLPLTANPNPVTIPVRKCIQAQQLIVGGENTTIGEFPHMAAVGFRDRNNQGIAWNCGGTLISDQFVLTAAHCTSTNLGRPIKVRLGAHNLKKNYNDIQFVDYSVIDIITHPDYKPPSKYNDIALLKLADRVTFYEHVRPACLNVDDTLSASRAIATGWGKMSYDGSVSEILLKVVLNIVDNNTCNRFYKINGKTAVLSRGIVSSQLCAGEISGGKDTCQGDSGGPLSITNTKCIHHIIGVTSFGKGCAQANTAGVYTRVSAYVPWIESVVWP